MTKTKLCPVPHAPLEYIGTLDDLYKNHVQQLLPTKKSVEEMHKLLVSYIQQDDPVYILRKAGTLERGVIAQTEQGFRILPSDNSPAWWMHHVLYQELIHSFGELLSGIKTVPIHFYEVAKAKCGAINRSRWHVAHILNVNDGKVDWINWSKEDLVARFFRNIHPCNQFYLPQSQWDYYGGSKNVLSYFKNLYEQRYGTVWQEFVDMSGGHLKGWLNALPAEDGSFLYECQPTIKNHPLSSKMWEESPYGIPAEVYYYSRFCFKADIIENLKSGTSFRMVTPVGAFQMRKEDVYKDFPKMVKTKSYQEGRIYHYPNVPKEAFKYQLDEKAAKS